MPSTPKPDKSHLELSQALSWWLHIAPCHQHRKKDTLGVTLARRWRPAPRRWHEEEGKRPRPRTPRGGTPGRRCASAGGALGKRGAGSGSPRPRALGGG